MTVKEFSRSSLAYIETNQPVGADVYQQYPLDKLNEASKGSGVSLLNFLARYPLEEVSGVTINNAFEQVWGSYKSNEERCIFAAKLFSVTKFAEEAHSLFDSLMSSSSPPDEIFKAIALLGWDCRAVLDAQKAETYEQFIKIKENCPSRMKAEAIIDAKVDAYCIKRANDAQTLDEALSVHGIAPKQSEGRHIARGKIKILISGELENKTSSAEIEEFFKSRMKYLERFDGICNIVFEKWDKCSMRDIAKAKVISELNELQKHIRPKADIVLDAFMKRAIELTG
jgi:hypothetical protein